MAFVNEWRVVDGINKLVTVDVDKNATFIYRPGVPEMPHQFELVWQGRKIFIDVIDDTRLYGTPKRDVVWKILQVHIGDDLMPMREEITNIINDALQVRGSGGQPEKTNLVTVDFSKTQWGFK